METEIISNQYYFLLVMKGVSPKKGGYWLDDRGNIQKTSWDPLCGDLIIAYYPKKQGLPPLQIPLLPEPPDGIFTKQESKGEKFTLDDMKKCWLQVCDLIKRSDDLSLEKLIYFEEFINTLKSTPQLKQFKPKYKYLNNCAGECGICEGGCNIPEVQIVDNIIVGKWE